MRFFLAALLFAATAAAADKLPSPRVHVTFDDREAPKLLMQGDTAAKPGVVGQSLAFSGAEVVSLRDSQGLTHGGFSLSIWVNPYLLSQTQQMIAAKNQYALNQRQWGVMIDKDQRFRLYVWQGRWLTASSSAAPTPGRWSHVGVVVKADEASLWINGRQAETVKLSKPIADTKAPITFGAVNDNGHVWQNFYGALDEARIYDRPLSATEIAAHWKPVSQTHEIPRLPVAMQVKPDPSWEQQLAVHAQADFKTTIFDGKSPNKLACDTTLRVMPDGSWVMLMLGGGDTEPLPANRVFISRSNDLGKSWSPLEPVDLGVRSAGQESALTPSELMVHGDRCTLFVATHDGTFGQWKEWLSHSDDSGRTWSKLMPAPGRLHERTFIRNHIVTSDGRIILPFQHYRRVGPTRKISKGRRFSPPTDPRNGVLISEDGGKTWSEHGDIRLTSNDDYHGWAENNVVELKDRRIAMIIRADRLGGVLYYAESSDGGRTWPDFATKTTIPNPGSKATLYRFDDDCVALLHNPNPQHRSPLSLWVSFDGMKSWPYQRVLVPQSADGRRGRLNYPDGFVANGRLHFAFDDNRHRAVYVSARLPPPPTACELWDERESLPTSADVETLSNVQFHVIKRWEPEADGYRWLHGLGLAFHQGKLYACFGHNRGEENTATEEARYCVSSDNGRTWSDARTIDAAPDPQLAVSHGVLHSTGEELWAFLGAFYEKRQRVHTRAYMLDEASRTWRFQGVVAEGGFWPMNQPQRLANGNWYLPGLIVGAGNTAGGAISEGNDLTKWKRVVIPKGPGIQRTWGESAAIVDGNQILTVSRYGGRSVALASTSSDGGETWGPLAETNLPMATSKPAAGVLSTGQRYLVCTTTADSGARRSPLTIAVSRPGKEMFSKVFAIRQATFEDGPGESHEQARLSYPCAIEHNGKLYVAYSNSKDRRSNFNSAELAVIPVSELAVD